MTEIEFLPESAKKIASFPIRSNSELIPIEDIQWDFSVLLRIKVTIALVQMRLSEWSRLAGDRIESAFLVGAPLDRYPAVNERFSNNEAYYGSGEGRYSYRQVCNPTKSDITKCQGGQGIPSLYQVLPRIC